MNPCGWKNKYYCTGTYTAESLQTSDIWSNLTCTLQCGRDVDIFTLLESVSCFSCSIFSSFLLFISHIFLSIKVVLYSCSRMNSAMLPPRKKISFIFWIFRNSGYSSRRRDAIYAVLVSLYQCHNGKNMVSICVFRWRGRWLQHFTVLRLGNLKTTNCYMQKKYVNIKFSKSIEWTTTNNDDDKDKNFLLKFQRVSYQRACLCVDSHKHTRTQARTLRMLLQPYYVHKQGTSKLVFKTVNDLHCA
jgi:hypothetical protein